MDDAGNYRGENLHRICCPKLNLIEDASPPAPQIRTSCDFCSRKKRKCSGEKPCARCQRAGVDCTYSNKMTLGRPRASPREDGRDGPKRPRGPRTVACSTARPAFSVSPATGLAGLAESRFLSCFLENFAPMCAVVDDASIRVGLMHAIASQWQAGSCESLQGEDAQKGQAFQCALFSSLVIGGLISGCPTMMVANHIASAHVCRMCFQGLSDRSVVAALILYGMSNALLGVPGSKAEYRQSMNDAREMSRSLADENALQSAFIKYRKYVDGMSVLTMSALDSVNPFNAWGRVSDVAGLGVTTADGRNTLEWIESGRERATLALAQDAHPAHVVNDALFLSIRYANVTERGRRGLMRVHDYMVSEITSLVRAQVGALVLSVLAGLLMGVKARLGVTDGLLPLAKLVSAKLHKCPGLARCEARCIACCAMAVFRLYGDRESYDALRNIISNGCVEHTPTYDEYRPGIPICEVEVIQMHAERVLRMNVFDVHGHGMASPSPF